MPEFVFQLPTPAGAPAPGESVQPDGTIDHSQGLYDRMPQQFKNDEVNRLLRVLTSPFAALEQAMLDVLTLTLLDNAVGQQLADIGKLVGQPNLDFPDDDTYRRYIRARIATNRSSGLTNQLIKICGLIVNDPALTTTIQRYGHASVMVQLTGLPIADSLAAIVLSFMKDAVGGGIRVVVTYSTQTTPNIFTLDDGPGVDDGYLLGSIE